MENEKKTSILSANHYYYAKESLLKDYFSRVLAVSPQSILTSTVSAGLVFSTKLRGPTILPTDHPYELHRTVVSSACNG